MTRLKRVVLLAAMLAIPSIILAQPTPPHGWGWRFGPHGYGYSTGIEVDRGKVDAAVKETLSKASKGQVWSTPAGTKHTPLLIDNEVIGQLWEDVDLKTLTIGAFWAGPWGVNVELVKDGRVIGTVWVRAAAVG
jgi:hypothetical protein